MAIYGKYVTEGVLGKSIPKELKLSREDIISASKFKEKTTKLLKYFDDNNFSEKKINKTVKFWYSQALLIMRQLIQITKFIIENLLFQEVIHHPHKI